MKTRCAVERIPPMSSDSQQYVVLIIFERKPIIRAAVSVVEIGIVPLPVLAEMRDLVLQE